MADFSSWSSHIGALLDDTQRNLGLLPLSNQRTHAQNGLNAGPATAAYTSRIGLPYTTASATPGSNLSASLLRADRAPVRLALDASIPPEAGNFGRSASAARLTAARAPSSPVYRSSAVTATAQPASLVAALNLSPSHHRALAATAAVSLAEPPTPLGSFARGTPSGDDPILSEARLTRVDDELSRIRSELNNRFEERLQDFEKREGRSIADLRSEFQVFFVLICSHLTDLISQVTRCNVSQMREQEQRAAARQELHALRVEIEVLVYPAEFNWMVNISQHFVWGVVRSLNLRNSLLGLKMRLACRPNGVRLPRLLCLELIWTRCRKPQSRNWWQSKHE
jgi:hypothetical protein